MPAKQKKKKVTRRTRTRTETLSVPPLLYQLRYERGIPVREVMMLEDDPDTVYARSYDAEVARSYGVKSFEDRVQMMLGTLYGIVMRPAEFAEKTLERVPRGAGQEFFETLVLDMVEIGDWATENREAILEAVDWWNVEYPDHAIEELEPEPSDDGTPWGAIAVALAGLVAGGYTIAKRVFFSD